jgi:PAS domain S-box-containing protein
VLDTPEDDESYETAPPPGDVLREYTPHPYQALTKSGELHAVNDAWVELLGYARQEARGRKFTEYLTPDSRATFESAFRRFKSDGALTGVDVDVVQATGGTVRVTIDGKIEYGDDGEVIRAHCQVVEAPRNGTGLVPGRQEQESNREATVTEESLKLAIEGAKLGVWDWDMQIDRVLRDELLTTMLGYSPAEMGDRLSDWERLVHPEGKKRHDEALKEHIEQRTEYYECDYRMETKSGDWKWVRTMGTIVERDADGAPVRAVGIHQDIDEQKRNHQKLARKTDQLEALNRVVRHDIRDQMSVVYGWAQELDEHVDEDGRVALEHVLDASEDVIDLTEVVRDIVHSLGSDDESSLEPVELSQHLRTELDRKRELYPQATFSVDGEIPSVSVRANEMLASVFRNLLGNAVEHNDADTPEVTVETTIQPDSVVVRIADNGPGIGAESAGRVFESGEKGVESTGTGTGLYLVHSLVEEFGGDVWVEEQESQTTESGRTTAGERAGAVFGVELPKAESEPSQSSPGT